MFQLVSLYSKTFRGRNQAQARTFITNASASAPKRADPEAEISRNIRKGVGRRKRRDPREAKRNGTLPRKPHISLKCKPFLDANENFHSQMVEDNTEYANATTQIRTTEAIIVADDQMTLCIHSQSSEFKSNVYYTFNNT
nr:hypothetical protein Iba_chr15aCG3190 [Ipomoea batatas]